MNYYSVLKRNKVSIHKKTWRKLRCVLLSDRSQFEKATYRMILTIWYSRKGKTVEIVKTSLVGCQGFENEDR